MMGGKQDSGDQFQKANNSDSDFECDDFIDDDEEFGGASRSVKLSIRALNFNMMLSHKNEQPKRVSLLSRASNYVAGNQGGRTSVLKDQKQTNYGRSSKLLNLYLQPQGTSSRDSCFMAGIDEREEFELTHDSNTTHAKGQSRPSNVAKKYNF